jgi:hypothetical protein
MRTCLFCERTDLSLEHVWPKWISKSLFGAPQRGRFTASRFSGPDRLPVGKSFTAAEFNHQARFVCARNGKGCNQTWMSQLEREAQGVLLPLLRGQNVTLDKYDQVVLRAWIVLRSMIFAVAASDTSAGRFYSREEHQSFAHESLEPFDGAYIWIFQFRSSQWVARTNVVNGGLDTSPGGPQAHRFQVVTANVGRFGFQICVARWPEPRRLKLDSPEVRMFQPAMAMLWPHASDTIEWPPGNAYLTDDHYDRLLDRLVKPGMQLER